MTFSVCFGANALAIGLLGGIICQVSAIRSWYSIAESQGMLAVSILLLATMGSSCSFWIYETLLLCLLVMLGADIHIVPTP